MTSLEKIKLGNKILRLSFQTLIFLMLLIAMVTSVYTLQFLKQDIDLKNNYDDCMVSLTEEVNRR